MSKTTITYDEFGAPEVRAQQKTMSDELQASINVPATGSIELTPDELREMANFVESSPQSPIVKILVRKGEPKKFVQGLRKAAQLVEESD